MIREIPPHVVEAFWPLVSTHLERALEFHPYLSVDGLRNLLLQGLAHLLVVMDGPKIIGAVAMEEQDYQGKKVGNVIACGTDIGRWKTHGEEVESYLGQWCRARNLGTLAMLGRPPWKRFVSRHGWKTQAALIAWKDL